MRRNDFITLLFTAACALPLAAGVAIPDSSIAGAEVFTGHSFNKASDPPAYPLDAPRQPGTKEKRGEGEYIETIIHHTTEKCITKLSMDATGHLSPQGSCTQQGNPRIQCLAPTTKLQPDYDPDWLKYMAHKFCYDYRHLTVEGFVRPFEFPEATRFRVVYGMNAPPMAKWNWDLAQCDYAFQKLIDECARKKLTGVADYAGVQFDYDIENLF